ncbi:hypothetical protein [Bacillus sp. FJAT-26390]|uniref:hypothetical protein n=1 Tax=Bacillus sp. FJAT-26390 TaxID=1743142 RepID=UPI000807E73F|nr:hypothetical protein [Bacillus sp. FJAT-26390]OBZ11432.1 hypothetical protein A7975_21120 [Bacillus sp. FJAT-26390]
MCKKGKWGFLIGLSMVLFILSGCASNEKTEEEKLVEAIQEAVKDSSIGGEASNKAEKPTVESTLSEIVNFVTIDIWNEAFVNISWYAGSGTDSTGNELDIEFTIDRLGKAMEKKAEYNSYIAGLDSKYDDIKQVWTKLSNEIDTLYAKLKENPPHATDSEYEFDTGLFKQYSKAFDSDVESLNAQ